MPTRRRRRLSLTLRQAVALAAALACPSAFSAAPQAPAIGHDERIAANRAEEFSWALSRNLVFAYELLDRAARARMSPPEFMAAAGRLFPSGSPTLLQATHFVPAAGHRAVDIFLAGRSGGGQFFRFRMTGSAADGYLVGDFSRLSGGPNPPARPLRADTGPFRTRPPASANPQVAFVPIAADASLVSALADTFRERLLLDTRLQPVYVPSARASDPWRRQLIGEVLATELEPRCRARGLTGTPFVIGVTGEDMYLRTYPRWRFAFSYRLRPCVAVVSYARMRLAPASGGDAVAPRLRKMIAKNLGVLVYALPPSKDPRSLMFDEILGTEDLDFIEENFERAGMGAASRQ